MHRRDVMRIGLIGVLGVGGLGLSGRCVGQSRAKRLLFFTRSVGFEHSVVRRPAGQQLSHAERILTELGRRVGAEVVCTKDGQVFEEDLASYDAIAFYTCGDLTRPSSDPGRSMSARGKQNLLDAVAAGKGFIGFHSAADTFHSQGWERDPYGAMLGGEFAGHGEQQNASLVLVSRFPRIRGFGIAEGLSFTDEWYALKNFAPDLHVILVQETAYLRGACYRRPDYPCTWARRHGAGRVFYTSLGHREDVWTNPFFQTIALGGLEWVLGNVEADVKPNIDQVTPHANLREPQGGIRTWTGAR